MKIRVRWYWLQLAAHFGLLVRELMVVRLLDGFGAWEVVAANAAMWLTLLICAFEVWRFSEVRSQAPKTIDMIMDMLLLPLNYGFFCVISVRILKLQPGDGLSGGGIETVSAVLGSAEIWEAWALWSVLALFVLVVDSAARRDTRRRDDAEYLETISAFKSLSLQGVKAFFYILTACVVLEVVVQGIAATHTPTLCYWLYGECASCSDWYHLHIYPVATSVVYILCSFALIFVFTFEHVFDEFLSCIQPFWKFWGVKGVVSVTFFQWLVIKFLFGSDLDKIYLLHCVACCVEMPLLALLHATFAYPYGRPWLNALLDHVAIVEETMEVTDCGDELSSRPSLEDGIEAREVSMTDLSAVTSSVRDEATEESVAPVAEEMRDLNPSEAAKMPEAADTADAGEDGDVADAAEAAEAAEAEGSHFAPLPQRQVQLRVPESKPGCAERCCALLVYALFGLILGYGSTRLVVGLTPPELDILPPEPLHVVTCSAQDLAHFVHSQSESLHWTMPSNPQGQVVMPGVAGLWLPLCGRSKVDCTLGYSGRPAVTCTAAGTYEWVGSCQAVVCGPPIRLPNGTPRFDDAAARQDWSSGMRVSYACDRGYQGAPVAVCGADGNYTVTGPPCTEVTCGSPPKREHMTASAHPEDVKSGEQVKYRCDTGYEGKPAVTCGDDGFFAQDGGCTLTCGTPPVIAHALLRNATGRSPRDMTVGTRLQYDCSIGFGGNPEAMCGEDGNWQEEGACETVCTEPPQMAQATVQVDVSQMLRAWTVGARVLYRCNPGYGTYSGDAFAECSTLGQWEFPAATKCSYLGCGHLEDYLSNVSSGWEAKMSVEEKLNFTSSDNGDVVIFTCTPGHTGHPYASCSHGEWHLTGACEIECGPPLAFPHSTPQVAISEDDRSWKLGRRVEYTCDAAYRGKPVAECASDGTWHSSGQECLRIGCGSLEAFMSSADPSWGDSMRMESSYNFSADSDRDVVVFNCAAGMVGRPWATCLDGVWSVSGRCGRALTSMGCRCKQRWTWCGGWAHGDCEPRHGCANVTSAPYSWCEVDAHSCPGHSGAPPSWDYCTDASPAPDERPGAAASVIESSSIAWPLAAAGFSAAAVVGLWRLLRAKQAAQGRHSVSSENSNSEPPQEQLEVPLAEA